MQKKNNLKFNISGRSLANEKDGDVDEKKYYSNIINDDFNFISKNKFPDSYKLMQSHKYTFSAFSTMAKENLSTGNRTGIILYKPNSNQSHILRTWIWSVLKNLKKKVHFGQI